MYQALYRKYRPRSFDEVTGQAHVTETLRRQVETGRVSHAYLFVGTRGTGKTTCAKILSRALNCEHPEGGNPCNKCASCRGIADGTIMDVTEIDAASNNGVDDIRTIRDEAVFTPASVKKRVYIIDEVHMLSASAWSALLKILEEPPEHLVFILATTEARKIPATILSRCQRFQFRRIMPEDIEKRLLFVAEKEHIDLAQDGAALLARLADGSMRDALSLLDQCAGGGRVDAAEVFAAVGVTDSAETAELFGDMGRGDAAAALGLFDRLYMAGRDPVSVMSGLLSLMRDVLLAKTAPGECAAMLSGAYGEEELRRLSGEMPTGALLDAAGALQDELPSAAVSRDKRTAAELCIMRLAARFGEKDAPRREAARPAPAPRAAGNASASAAREPAAAVKAAELPAAELKREPEPPKEARREAPAAAAVPAPSEDEAPPWEDDDAPPEQEPLPAPAAAKPPETGKAPETEPAAPDAGEGWWESVLAAAEKTVDTSVYMFLSDKAHVTASLSGSVLTVYAKNAFISQLIDSQKVKDAVAAAAASALGRAPAVRVAVGSAPAKTGGDDRLASLKRFSNIKFE